MGIRGPGSGHAGQLPGLLEGRILLRWGKHVYDFENQDITHIAAALSCALEVDRPVAKSLRDGDLLALGENIDLLVKTNLLAKEESAADDKSLRCPDCATTDVDVLYNGQPSESYHCREKKCGKRWRDSKKFEAPGGHASQKPPAGFQEPEGQTGKSPSRNRKVSLTRSQAATKCSVCDAPQFSGDVFVGCFCLRDLAKHADAEATGQGFTVSFGPEWSKQDVSVFMDIVGGEA
jgi:hypothetical protein